MLVFSVILMSLALIIYTVSILNEFWRKKLLPWHAFMFCTGFCFDVASTIIMYKLGGSRFSIGVHSILGGIALSLMLTNAIGSIILLNKSHKNLLIQFYKFSFFAWIIWVPSYIIGAVMHI